MEEALEFVVKGVGTQTSAAETLVGFNLRRILGERTSRLMSGGFVAVLCLRTETYAAPGREAWLDWRASRRPTLMTARSGAKSHHRRTRGL